MRLAIKVIPHLLIALSCTISTVFAKRIELVPFSRIQSSLINESSGIVKSPNWPDIYWTHNDSGDQARIFAITKEGYSIYPDWVEGNDPSIRITDAINTDWEDIATDSKGRIYIGNCGNNSNSRRDLALYVISEPNPRIHNKTPALKKISFKFPDQTEFPPVLRNFDCEALFIRNTTPYFLTKHRSDTFTKLYRLDEQRSDIVNELTLIDAFDIGGKVTAADLHSNEELLAVLTNKAIWVFEKPKDSDHFLSTPLRKLGIKAGQCEALCWESDDSLMITNEEGYIFRIPLSAIPFL